MVLIGVCIIETMPTYCYRTDDGKITEIVCQMGKAPQSIRLKNDKWATRDFQAERVAVPATKGWPMTCCASGVNAGQADELRKHFRDRGCPTEVTGDGDPVYRSANHRKKALKCRGIHDNSSFL